MAGASETKPSLGEGLKRYGRRHGSISATAILHHVHRSALLKEGATLSEAIDAIRKSLGVSARFCDER